MSEDVVYGRQPVREALRGRRAVREVLATAKARESLPWLAEADCPVREADAGEIGNLAHSADHQGVVARVAPFPYADPDELLEGPAPLVIALDGVTDPHNLGAIARSAECAGAVEHLPIAVAPNLADWLGRAKRPGLWTYAAAADGAVPYAEADYTDGCVFVLGAEGAGLRPRVRAACDAAVALPINGRIDSLNVSVAAGVLLFEAVRQRGAR